MESYKEWAEWVKKFGVQPTEFAYESYLNVPITEEWGKVCEAYQKDADVVSEWLKLVVGKAKAEEREIFAKATPEEVLAGKVEVVSFLSYFWGYARAKGWVREAKNHLVKGKDKRSSPASIFYPLNPTGTPGKGYDSWAG